MSSEEYIKFSCDFRPAKLPHFAGARQLIEWRQRFYNLGLIGKTDGVGYGNISVRQEGKQFLISGTQTGGLPKLELADLALIENFNIDANSVRCTGERKASAESLSHAAIYEATPKVHAVVHIHSADLWERLTDVPRTESAAAYGTPEIARALYNSVQRTVAAYTAGVIVMGGHPEGLMLYGATFDDLWDHFESIARSAHHKI